MMLSIIVPCYNSGEYLRECIDSLLAAADGDTELVLVDDGSTDNTAEIISSYEDPRIKSVRQENSGPGSARNLGITISTGEYIMFVDDDDVVSADIVRAVRVSLGSGRGADLIYFKGTSERNVFYRTENESTIPEQPEITADAGELILDILSVDRDTSRELIDKGYYLHGPAAKVYRRSIIDKFAVRFPEKLRWGEDICFNLRYLKGARIAEFIPVTVYYYRQTESSLINGYYPGKAGQIAAFLKEAKEYIDSENQEQIKAFDHLAAKQYIYILQHDLFHRDNSNTYTSRVTEAKRVLKEDINISEGIKRCNIRKMNKSVALCVGLARMKMFRILQLIIRAYQKVS